MLPRRRLLYPTLLPERDEVIPEPGVGNQHSVIPMTMDAFEPGTVTGRDVYRGIDAELTGGLPVEHVVGDVAFEQTLAVEVPEHPVAHGVLQLVPVGGREMDGLVELDRALGILAEHAVDDTDVEMEVCVNPEPVVPGSGVGSVRSLLPIHASARLSLHGRPANVPFERAL